MIRGRGITLGGGNLPDVYIKDGNNSTTRYNVSGTSDMTVTTEVTLPEGAIVLKVSRGTSVYTATSSSQTGKWSVPDFSTSSTYTISGNTVSDRFTYTVSSPYAGIRLYLIVAYTY